MIYCTCPHCGAKLEISENDNIGGPGFRESEEVECPVCNEVVTKVFTSGFPTAREVE